MRGNYWINFLLWTYFYHMKEGKCLKYLDSIMVCLKLHNQKSISPHCQFSGFSFTFIFCYFCWRFTTLPNLVPNFFREITMFSSKKFSFHNFFFNFFIQLFFLRSLIASNGARVRGSVFKIEFWAFSREFEYIETSPRFAQLHGENWG